jgi:hypothetical protein
MKRRLMLFNRNFLITSMVLLLSAGVTFAEEVLVVASKELAEASLTKDQIREAFLGNPIRSSSGVSIQAFDRKRCPELLRERFYRSILGMGSTQLKSYWSQQIFTGRSFPPKTLDDLDSVKKELNANVGSISFISRSEFDQSLKPLFKIGVKDAAVTMTMPAPLSPPIIPPADSKNSGVKINENRPN